MNTIHFNIWDKGTMLCLSITVCHLQELQILQISTKKCLNISIAFLVIFILFYSLFLFSFFSMVCQVDRRQEPSLSKCLCALMSIPWVQDHNTLSVYQTADLPANTTTLSQKMAPCFCKLVHCHFYSTCAQ